MLRLLAALAVAIQAQARVDLRYGVAGNGDVDARAAPDGVLAAAFVEPVTSMLEAIRNGVEASEVLVAHGRFHDECRDVEATLLVLARSAG